MDLKTKYRPQTLDDFIYLSPQQHNLIHAWFNKIQSHAYLLTGGSGLGKTTLAQIFARHVGALGDTLIEGLDYFEFNCAATGGKEDALDIIGLMQQPPTIDARVIVLDEAQKLSNAAQNALLKPLENLGDNNYVIMCSTEPEKLIPALRTRCLALNFTYDLKHEDYILEQLSELGDKIYRGENYTFAFDKFNLLAQRYISTKGSEFSIRNYVAYVGEVLEQFSKTSDIDTLIETMSQKMDVTKKSLWYLVNAVERQANPISAYKQAKLEGQSASTLLHITTTTILKKVIDDLSTNNMRHYLQLVAMNAQQIDYFTKLNDESKLELILISILSQLNCK